MNKFYQVLCLFEGATIICLIMLIALLSYKEDSIESCIAEIRMPKGQVVEAGVEKAEFSKGVVRIKTDDGSEYITGTNNVLFITFQK